MIVTVWTRPSKRWSYRGGNGWDWAERNSGGVITLSNNPANQVRPLLGLAAAGLIVLKGGPSCDSGIEDVDTAASRVRLTPIDPTLTAQSLDRADAAFVDDTFAVPAGLTADEVIYTDDPQRPELTQYINVFAARAETPTI